MQDLSKSQEESEKYEVRIKGRTSFYFILLTFCFSLFTSSSILLASSFAADLPSPYAVESLTGQKAPDFTLNNISGKSITLSSVKGKVVILVFWAPWCPPCKEELKSLNKLYRIYKGRGLVILAVASDKSLSSVKEFIAQNPVDFEVLLDGNLTVSRDLYKAFMVPTAFVIDKRGVIFKKHFGEQDWTKPELVREIDALL
jgi:peroxiredoxin